MLITLNELGKFLYKSINEFMASLSKQCKSIGQFCGCLPPEPKKGHKDRQKLIKNDQKSVEDQDKSAGIVSFNL